MINEIYISFRCCSILPSFDYEIKGNIYEIEEKFLKCIEFKTVTVYLIFHFTVEKVIEFVIE